MNTWIMHWLFKLALLERHTNPRAKAPSAALTILIENLDADANVN